MITDTEEFINDAIRLIQEKSGGEKVVIALSGGVDSSVCAELASRAIGERLVPIYVDTGLMRKGETARISEIFGPVGLKVVNAADEFLDALEGESDPEKKRKIVGERFIRVFEREAVKTGAKYLLQGTIYPDCVESDEGIKSHHNVGGLPLNIQFDGVIEPLKSLQGGCKKSCRSTWSSRGDCSPDAIPWSRPFGQGCRQGYKGGHRGCKRGKCHHRRGPC